MKIVYIVKISIIHYNVQIMWSWTQQTMPTTI